MIGYSSFARSPITVHAWETVLTGSLATLMRTVCGRLIEDPQHVRPAAEVSCALCSKRSAQGKKSESGQ